MMAVTCPWCDYSGMVPAVEAHISGKVDEAHRGKVGHDLHDHLPQTEASGGESNVGDGSPTFAELPESGGESSDSSAWPLLVATVVFAVVVLLMVADVDLSSGVGLEERAGGKKSDGESEGGEQMELVA